MLRRPRTLFGTQVVYDASPLVRSELAVALARLVRGHMPLLEDATDVQDEEKGAALEKGAPERDEE